MSAAIRKHIGDFVAVLVLFAIGIGIAGYILSEQRLRFPLVEERPFTVKVELENAQAVIPGQGQTVRIAGVRVGDIGSVELQDGKAVVELQLDPEYAGRIKRNATALLRTKTGLKDMFIEVDPGAGQALERGGRIRVENTATDTDPDEILSALDRDTRDYLKLLISGAGKGLEGRGQDLRETLKRFEPLHRDLARVSEAVARRRRNLARLVNRYGLLTRELAAKDGELTRLVGASNSVLESFASENRNISAFVSRLPGALEQTSSTLVKVDELGRVLGPALESLRPAFRGLDAANREVLPLAREGAPILRDQVRPFARIARPYTRDFGQASRDLAAAGPDLARTFGQLNRLFNIGAYNPGGNEGISRGCENDGTCTREERARNEGYLYWLAWVAQHTVSLFNTSDAQGPLRRITLGGLDCGVFEREATGVGVPPTEAAQLVGLFGSLGVCAS